MHVMTMIDPAVSCWFEVAPISGDPNSLEVKGSKIANGCHTVSSTKGGRL